MRPSVILWGIVPLFFGCELVSLSYLQDGTRGNDGGRESARFTIESYALPGNYLFVAINSTMFVFARCFKEARAFAAAQFLEDLILRNLRNSIGRDDQLFGECFPVEILV